jgi:hypothetical protein
MRHALLLLFAFLPLPALASPVAGPHPSSPPPLPFIRYVDKPANQPHLDTAIAHFKRGAVQVDLVAAIHIADVRYYQQLQKKLDAYPKLLFELVAADGQQFARTGVRTDSGVSGVQLWLRDKLGLSFQLQEIDYKRANFVHADLSPDELVAHLKSHWVDTLGMLLRWMLSDAARSTNADGSIRFGGLELFGAFQPGMNRNLLVKRMLARELSEMGDLTGATGASDALIARRNEAALTVLQAQMAAGVKKLGIFYGGAHMPDMQRRLEALGFARTGTDWLVAWELRH